MSRCLLISLLASVVALLGCNRSSSDADQTAAKSNAVQHRGDEENHSEHDHSADHVGASVDGHAHGYTESATASSSARGSSRYSSIPAEEQAEAPSAGLPVDAPPDAVVTTFLEATRRGDDDVAATLLSAKALAETSRMGLAVKPPGTPTMQYEIGEIEYPPEVKDGAYVHSRWTERFAEADESYQITWILRKQPAGWRIVGMAAELSDTEPPYLLNFEEPKELYDRIHEAGPEIAAPAYPNEIPRTAANPTATRR